MTALIRCTLRLSKIEMDLLLENEDDFMEAWEQVKYYLGTVSQVKFE